MTINTRINVRPVREWISDPYGSGTIEPFVEDSSVYRYDGPSAKGDIPAASSNNQAGAFFAVSVDLGVPTIIGYDCIGFELDYKLSYDLVDPSDPVNGCGLEIMVIESCPETGEMWVLDLDGATGGTYDLGVSGNMRTLAYNATTAEISAALDLVFGQGLPVAYRYGAIQMSYRLGNSGLQASFTGLSGAGSPSLTKIVAYSAASASYEIAGHFWFNNPADWTEIAWNCGARGRSLYSWEVDLYRDGAYDVTAWLDNIELTPSIDIDTDEIVSLVGAKFCEVPTTEIEIDYTGGFGPLFCEVPTTEIEIEPYPPALQWSVPAGVRKQLIFVLFLTGVADGLLPLEIPISSFSARMRTDERSYIEASIPNSLEYAAGIAARPNGQLVIKAGYRFADGRRQLQTIARAANDVTFSFDRGPNSDTGTISGYGYDAGDISGVVRELTGVSYVGVQSDGKMRVRCALDIFIQPSDIVVYGAGAGERFTGDYITWTVQANPPAAIMEITELG